MKKIEDEIQTFKKLMQLFARQFGSNCEVVLHDITRDYESTIVDIVNGHVSGRKVGDSGTNLGLEVLRGTKIDGDRFNYISNTQDGKILRSSSVYFYNDAGKVIGALCVNQDITESLRLEKYIYEQNGGYSLIPNSPTQENDQVEEFITSNVAELLDCMLGQAQKHVGVPPQSMTREHKLAFLKYLDEKGALLISKYSERTCKFLNISKFTFYNYLDTVRKNSEMAK